MRMRGLLGIAALAAGVSLAVILRSGRGVEPNAAAPGGVASTAGIESTELLSPAVSDLGPTPRVALAGRFCERGSERGIAGAAIVAAVQLRGGFIPERAEVLGSTDASGAFQCSVAVEGAPRFTLYAVAESASGSLEFGGDETAEERTKLRIESSPAGSLEVTVLTPQDLADHGPVTLVAFPSEEFAGPLDAVLVSPWAGIHARTLQAGEPVVFEALPAASATPYVLAALAYRGASLTLAGIEVAPGAAAQVEFDLRGLFDRSLRVRAVDVAGVPLAGVRVARAAGASRAERELGSTDASGSVLLPAALKDEPGTLLEFTAAGYVAARYRVRRSAEWAESAAIAPDWRPRAGDPVAVLLRRAGLAGTVVDQHGGAAAGIRVEATSKDPVARGGLYRSAQASGGFAVADWRREPTDASGTETDGAGRFVLDAAEEGPLAVSLRPPRAAWANGPLSIAVDGGDRDLRFVLVRLPDRIPVVLYLAASADAAPVPAATCFLQRVDPSVVTGLCGIDLERSGASFRGDVPPGEWLAQIRAADGRSALDRFHVLAGAARVERTVELSPAATVRVSLGGLPAGAAVGVRIARIGGAAFDATPRYSFYGAAQERLGNAGADVVFAGVPEGTIEVRATGEGAAGRAAVTVAAGAEVRVHIVCVPAGVVRLAEAAVDFGEAPAEALASVSLELRSEPGPWWIGAERSAGARSPAAELCATVPPGRVRWRAVRWHFCHDAAGRGTRVLGEGEVEVAAGGEVVVGAR